MPRSDREALIEIGNIVGAPTMQYSPKFERGELMERGEKISKIVQEQLGITPPVADPEKFRTNPSGTRAVHDLIRGSNWG